MAHEKIYRLNNADITHLVTTEGLVVNVNEIYNDMKDITSNVSNSVFIMR